MGIDYYCELCKFWGQKSNHETCKYVKKFKCMCGCERKYNIVELQSMGLSSRTKIKCRRSLLECRECEKNTTMLFSIYQGGKYLKSLCPKCLIKIYETYKELRDVESKIMSECQNKRILHGAHYMGTEASKKLILYKSSYNIYRNIINAGIVLMRNNIPKELRHKIIMEIILIYISEMNDIKVSEYHKHKY